MTDLVVFVPSRGRPEKAAELVEAFRDTCVADTKLVFAVDDNDESRADYPTGVKVFVSASRNMGQALHSAAMAYLAEEPFAVGFMGDDHRPRSHGWDKAYLDALREFGTGMIYGNDLLQGERIPTQMAMTADIVRALGFMAPPALIHLYFDNFWLSLGKAIDRIRYLPDVVVEHVHPIAGKAEWDAGYARVNSQAMYARDERAFFDYMRDSFVGDVAKVQALL